ncbi:SP_1767 family glycosyltransferase [Solibacillus sp. FSL W7-1324]|uniref:SP_1767 family glycosyltransferase n=1 Tax=Solibacillus sp. FSL W7-1324 TaxID=2921701 RepID=UPI0030F6155A
MKNTLYKLYKYICYIHRKVNNKYLEISILEDQDVIDRITKEKLSLARFGDGELGLIINKSEIGFQESSDFLIQRLKEVLIENNDSKLLIGVPKIFVEDSDYDLKTKMFWACFIVKRFDILNNLLSQKKVYANASLTRPYMDYKVKNLAKKRFENIKKLWEKRDVIIVEGDSTFFGVGNDLFDNIKSIRRIVCPSKNAFIKYNEILESILEEVSSNTLILMALGPTATLLAADLSKKGYQALDIGHIDIEYEWFRKSAKYKIEIEGKNINEVSGEGDIKPKYIANENYTNEIISIIK